MQPPTVIFHLSARFRADTHPKKLNLGVGAYRDEALKPYVFSAVRKAEAAVVAAGFDKEYLPITGYPAFNVSVPPQRDPRDTPSHMPCVSPHLSIRRIDTHAAGCRGQTDVW